MKRERAVVSALLLVLALSLLGVLRWELAQRRGCVETCRRGGWEPGADQCERLCAGGRP